MIGSADHGRQVEGAEEPACESGGTRVIRGHLPKLAVARRPTSALVRRWWSALPEGVRQVEIVKVGRSRLISPAGQSWDEFFDGPEASDDFMRQREQPEVDARKWL